MPAVGMNIASCIKGKHQEVGISSKITIVGKTEHHEHHHLERLTIASLLIQSHTMNDASCYNQPKTNYERWQSRP